MNDSYTVDGLAGAVNEWCDRHGIIPASGQSGERMTARNVRYYRTLGLVDGPLTGGGEGYGEKHRLQLIAIRLLQAQGLPLNRVRDLLYGRTLEELREIEQRGLAEAQEVPTPIFQPNQSEAWTVTPIDEEFLIVSRRGRGFTEATLARLREVLHARPPTPARPKATR